MSNPNPLGKDLDHILDHTKNLWNELRGKRIFITGGTGFFGCWLLESFARANDTLDLDATMIVLSRNPANFQKKAPHLFGHDSIRFHTGDVHDFAFPEGKFSHVIHASNEAADYIGRDCGPGNVRKAIVRAAGHVLEFARHCGAGSLLYTSSGSVYGPQPSHISHLPETYEGIRDVSIFRFAHGEGKLTVERMCMQYEERYGIAAKIARCFTFVGPYMKLDANYAVGNFIRDGLRGGPVVVKGDGTACRSYMYAADLAIWLWTILIRGESMRPYNVGSMVPCSVGEVAGAVSRQFPETLNVIISGTPKPGQNRDIYVPDTSRAMTELELDQWIPLDASLKRTIKFFSAKAA